MVQFKGNQGGNLTAKGKLIWLKQSTQKMGDKFSIKAFGYQLGVERGTML